MVVLFHYLFRWPVIYCPSAKDGVGFLSSLAQYGYLGVDLFFIISGFVILFSSQNKSASQFAVGRFLRLYPAYWLGVSFTALVLLLFPLKENAFSLADYFLNLTMLQGYFRRLSIDGVYWTLMVELQFYAFIFFIIAIGKIHHIEKWLWAWFLVSVVLMFGESPILRILGALTIASWSFYFISGCLFYLIYDTGCSLKRCLLLAFCWVMAIFAGINRVDAMDKDYNWAISFSPIIIASVISLFFGLFFLFATKRLRLFESPYWVVIGGVTYPLYLIHQCVGYVLLNAVGKRLPAWAGFLMVFLLMLGLAFVISKYAETPMRRWLGPVVNKWLENVPAQWSKRLKTLSPGNAR